MRAIHRLESLERYWLMQVRIAWEHGDYEYALWATGVAKSINRKVRRLLGL